MTQIKGCEIFTVLNVTWFQAMVYILLLR